ncbi:hypothetical protein PRNP1_013192 [Phytophthora ramorum]
MSGNSSLDQRDPTSDPSPHSSTSASSRSPSPQQRATTSDPSIAVPTAHDATATVPAASPRPVQRIEGQPGALPVEPLPQVGSSLPPLDQTTIRRSLAAVEAALDRESEFHALQRSNNDLLQSYFALRQRVADLEHTIRSAAQSASPFVCFVQQKYDQLSHCLAQSTLDLAETREALAQRLDNATELTNLRDRMRLQDRVHAEAVADFQKEIDDLERRLTAALAVASTTSGDPALPLPGVNPNTLQLQSQLNVAIAAQGLANRDLNQVRESIRDLETSQKALEGSAQIHRQQVALLERRASELRDQLAQARHGSRRALDQSLQERQRLQDLLNKSDQDLHDQATKLQRMTQERDRVRNELSQARNQVTSARLSIARLEQRASNLQSSVAANHPLSSANAVLRTDLVTARKSQQDLESVRDQLITERDGALRRVSDITSILQPGSIVPPATPVPTPASDPSLLKKTPSRKRLASQPPSRRSPSSPSSRRKRPHKSRRRRSPSPGDSDDDALNAGLARSRSSGRRLHLSRSKRRAAGTPSKPINVDSSSDRGSDGQASDDGDNDDGGNTSDDDRDDNDGGNAGDDDRNDGGNDGNGDRNDDGNDGDDDDDRTDGGNDGDDDDDGDKKNSDHEGDNGDSNDDDNDDDVGGDGGGDGGDSSGGSSVGDHHSGDSDSSDSANAVLSDAELGQLDPTTISRDRWIPGYRSPVRFAGTDVDPWPLSPVRQLSVRHLTVATLFRQWSRPPSWLFPRRTRTPSAGTWNPDLITQANILALYKLRPWIVLGRAVPPQSFDATGWFAEFVQLYAAFEEEFRQAFWESTHKLPITKAMKLANPFLAKFWLGCKQRRSRAGPRWQTILKHLLAGMIAGHCDLDLLLDPFFLHFPRQY